jgi:hypothetical protein
MADETRPEPGMPPSTPTVPDLGFFTQPSVPAPASPPQQGTVPAQTRFGAPANQPGAPVSQFGAPPVNQSGGPPVSQFGAPPVNQSGTPVAYGAPTPGPAPRGLSGAAKAAIAGLSLVLLTALVFGGRFGWHHFGADPVLPDTLMGMPQVTGATVTAALQAAKDSVGDELTAGSEAKVGLYSDGDSSVYIVFALRGGSSGTDDGDAPDDWTQTRHGKVDCFQPPSGAETSATLCARAFFRRAVMVMSLGPVTPAATVAKATEEAWGAQ